MHEVNVKGILSAKNGMNIYRGCLHGCIYCDSRSLCYQMKHKFVICTTHFDFSFIFFNKSRSRRTFVDFVIIVTPKPYLSITSRHFRILPSFSSIGTKVLRDLDLLKKINEKSKCVVQMTLTTYHL